MRKATNLLVSSLFGLAVLAGCSTEGKVTRTETVYEPTHAGEPPPDSARVTKVESTETHTGSGGEPGVVSGTVDLVGKTVALPFRIVGGLVDFVF
jgi:hypothetical protein